MVLGQRHRDRICVTSANLISVPQFLNCIMGGAVQNRAFLLGNCSAGKKPPRLFAPEGNARHKRAITHFSMGQTQSHGFSFLPPMKYSEASGTRPVLGGGCCDEGSRLGLEKPIKDLTLSFGPGSRPWKLLEASPPGALPFALRPSVCQEYLFPDMFCKKPCGPNTVGVPSKWW